MRRSRSTSRRSRLKGSTRHEFVVKLVPKHKNQRSMLQRRAGRADWVHCLWSQARVGLRPVQVTKEPCMGVQIVMDGSGDTRHEFHASDIESVAKAEERFQALTGKASALSRLEELETLAS
jgi:hypothetical protein